MPFSRARSATALPTAAAASLLPVYFSCSEIAFSTVEKAISEQLKYTGNKDAAAAVGKAVAERAIEKGITGVSFDRSGFQYHGRVQALADAAREAGLQF